WLPGSGVRRYARTYARRRCASTSSLSSSSDCSLASSFIARRRCASTSSVSSESNRSSSDIVLPPLGLGIPTADLHKTGDGTHIFPSFPIEHNGPAVGWFPDVRPGEPAGRGAAGLRRRPAEPGPPAAPARLGLFDRLDLGIQHRDRRVRLRGGRGDRG